MKPVFFPAPSDFRAWFEKHHDRTKELWVGFYKKDSGKPSITWPESVDAALSFGWIDGIRKSVDTISYMIRFTPRKPGSTWSAVNIRRFAELTSLGLMRPAGLEAFQKRTSEKSGIYSYEQRYTLKLDGKYETKFRANKKAWTFFQTMPPWYRRTTTHWVLSAKQDATRLRRLARLIEDSKNEKSIPQLDRSKSK